MQVIPTQFLSPLAIKYSVVLLSNVNCELRIQTVQKLKFDFIAFVASPEMGGGTKDVSSL